MQKKRSLKSILEVYSKRGFYLFPVSGKSKRPVFKDMLNRASNDVNQLLEWSKEYPDCGWAISLAKSNLWAVDIDTKHGGMEIWQGLIESHGEIETLVQQSGSGGLHYVFKYEDDLKLKGKIRSGIDIKHKGYIVVYPTIHKSGHQYIWRAFKSRKIKTAPQWVKDLCEKTQTKKKTENPSYKLGTGYLSKLVSELKKFDLAYDEWVSAGMALHSATDGNEHGLNLFLDLTQGVSYQEGDTEKARYKWESFDANESDGVTARTLTYFIRQKGGIVPNPSFESDVRAFREAQAAEILQEAEEHAGWFSEGEKKICVHTDFIIEDFHEQGYAYYENGGNAPILSITRGPQNEIKTKTLTLNAFQSKTAPYFFKYYKRMANGDRKPTYVPASKVWLESFRRKSFSDIVLKEPGTELEGDLNVWSGLPCRAIEGDVTSFLLYIEQAICDNNKAHSEWLLDWLAHMVQKPFEKPTVVPVLIGDQGTGKGLLADGIVKRILGHLYYRVMTAQNLKERFNKEQSQKLFVFIDEATWRGDNVEDGILKSLTGSDTMTVEEKHGARYNIENIARYLIASNNEEAIKIERSNRRYNYIQVSKNFAGNTEYFKPLWDGLKKGKLANYIYDFLLKRDISEFNAFQLPSHNLQGKTAKIASEGIVAMFWEDVFFQNPKELWLEGEYLLREDTYQEFLNFTQHVRTYERNLSRANFWRKSHKLMPECVGSSQRPSATRTNGKRPSVSIAPPERMVEDFCRTLKIEQPDGFEPLEYFLENDFNEMH